MTGMYEIVGFDEIVGGGSYPPHSIQGAYGHRRRRRHHSAFALGKAKGPSEGLLLLSRSDIDVNTYPYVHLVRAALFEDAGQMADARVALEEAALCARNEHERRQIAERLSRLTHRSGG